MNEHRKYEIQCLLELIAVIVNKEQMPNWRRVPEWGNVFKTADYHHVANTVYGLIVGMDGKQLRKWKGKFEERFRYAVILQERYEKAEQEVMAAMERNKIHCLESRESVLTSCYERSEYRIPGPIEIFAEKGKTADIHRALIEIGFEKKDLPGQSETSPEIRYSRTGGINVTVFERFTFTSKKMNRYFSISPKDFPGRPKSRHIHKQDMEDFYICLMAYITERYARGSIEIRDILDLWEYYLKCYEQVDWKDINKELKFLEIDLFADRIIKLAAIWFGRLEEFSAELEQLVSMETYIISKGTEAREENEKILPLVREVAHVYERDLKREARKKQLAMWFPEREYMEAIYPVLSKYKIFLPLCWVRRLVNNQWRKMKAAVKRKFEPVTAAFEPIRAGWRAYAEKRREKKQMRKEEKEKSE